MEVQGGYELERFNSPVPHGLRCNICKEVLREPKLCKNGGHPFCHHCIQQNLVQTKKCPVCRKHLTPETLVHPQECFLRILKDLEIKCDYHERGCYRPVLLGNLQDHVTQCGFAPVTCEKCGMQINKKDKDNHEKSFCPLKAITECKDCGNIKNTQNKMKTTQDEMKASITKQGKFVSEQFAQIIKEQERDIQIGTSIIANQEDLKRKHDQMEVTHNSFCPFYINASVSIAL